MGFCEYPIPERLPIGVGLSSISRMQHNLNRNCPVHSSVSTESHIREMLHDWDKAAARHDSVFAEHDDEGARTSARTYRKCARDLTRVLLTKGSP